MRNWLDRLWVLGRYSARAYLRLYPNPGFMVRAFGKCLKYSTHDGWSVRKA